MEEPAGSRGATADLPIGAAVFQVTLNRARRRGPEGPRPLARTVSTRRAIRPSRSRIPPWSGGAPASRGLRSCLRWCRPRRTTGKRMCAPTSHSGWRLTDDSLHDIGLAGDDRGRGALIAADSPRYRWCPWRNYGNSMTVWLSCRHAPLSPSPSGLPLSEPAAPACSDPARHARGVGLRMVLLLGCLLLSAPALEARIAECGCASTESSGEAVTCSQATEARVTRSTRRRVVAAYGPASSPWRGGERSVRDATVLLHRPSRTDVPSPLGRSGQQRTVRLRRLLI